MGQVKNPIICGRRNCAACGRWKHAVDFRWRWSNPEYTQKPRVDTICFACMRERERQRYRSMSYQQKAEKIRKGVEAKKKRDAKKDKKLAAAKRTAKHYQDGYVDFVPFRMWLLLKNRTDNNLSSRAKVSQTRINEWLEGCTWTSASCEPTPISSVALKTVEDVTTRLGDPGAAAVLYPLEY